MSTKTPSGEPWPTVMPTVGAGAIVTGPITIGDPPPSGYVHVESIDELLEEIVAMKWSPTLDHSKGFAYHQGDWACRAHFHDTGGSLSASQRGFSPRDATVKLRDLLRKGFNR